MTLTQIHIGPKITKSNIATFIYILLCASLLTSCATTQQTLSPDKYLLKKNAIIFSSEERIDNKEDLRYGILSLIKQDENISRLWPPKNWFSKDTMIVYDPELGQESAESIEKFLRNKKGYYKAKVKHNVDIDNKQLTSNYYVDLNKRYRVKSFQITSQDKSIVDEINNLPSLALIREGDPVDSELFETERSRIVGELQNLGYANFVSNFIEIIGDSTNYLVDVEFNVIVPPPDSVHKKYYIGEINVFTEHLVQSNPSFSIRDTFERTNYFGRSSEFIVKPKFLAKNIYLRNGNLYLNTDRIKTQRTLNSLSSYKYVQVNPKLNTEKDSIFDIDIFLSPYEHKWISEQGLDLFYAFGSTSFQQNLFGLSAFGSLQNRNVFGGSEKYSFNLDGSVELSLPSLAANRWSFGANNILELPRLVDLFSFGKFLENIRVIPTNSYDRFKDEARTDISLGYNFTKSIRNFSISSFNASWGYTYRANAQSLYKMRQLGLNLFIFNPTDNFRMNNLDDNPLLANSFQDNISTGFLFRDLRYFFYGKKNRRGRSVSLLTNFEVSGLEIFLANKLANLISGENVAWTLGKESRFNFAKYVKLELDGRIYKDITKKSQLAARADIGLVVPFGKENDGTLLQTPYLSQFYAGGPNSNRAWQIRELGPGGYSEVLEPPFFQAGDLKIEFNLEYRWNLFLFFEGALFLDAGNIWTLRTEEARPNSKISADFLDQMAVGTGWGIRADFTYFLIRLDFGYKLRSPFPLDDSGSHLVFGKTIPGTDGESYNSLLGNINVAINYPF